MMRALNRNYLLLVVFVIGGMSASDSLAGDAFARVGDESISHEEFEQEVVMAARQTYYHGRPASQAAFVEFRKSVADDLVDRHLLLREANRRGIEADQAAIEARLNVYEQRYGETDRWKVEGTRMLSALRQRFEQDSKVEILERGVRAVGEPTDNELRDFYGRHPDKFTEPMQLRLSVILLAVDPSATPAVWAAARAEAARIGARLDQGADFAELARLHSSDRSSGQGGDMGYLHAGMLSPAAESSVKDLSIGKVSDAVTVLEGVAIFQVTDRKAERLRPFAEVSTRVAELWARDMGDRQWASLLADLRGADDVFIDAAYLASVPSLR